MSKDFETSCIVMEWLPTNMFDVLKARRVQGLGQVPVPQATEWIARLAAGLMAIHSARFIHRDIKPANVLLDESLKRCKISDLGVSRALHSVKDVGPAVPMGTHLGRGALEENTRGAQMMFQQGRRPSTASQNTTDSLPEFDSSSGVSGAQSSLASEHLGSMLSGYTVRPGTVAYTSPEARETGNYGCATDVYSLGVLVLEILTLKPPNEVRLGEEVEAADVRHNAKKQLRGHAQEELASLCMEMLAPAEERPQATDIAASPILRPVMQELVQQCGRLGELLGERKGAAKGAPTAKKSAAPSIQKREGRIDSLRHT